MNNIELNQFVEYLIEERQDGLEADIKCEQILQICDSFISLDSAPFVQVQAPCYVIGDIHAQFSDLMTYFKNFGYDSTYVFLGDYVDRGYLALECLMLLFALKIQKPQNFILLRGNHELKEVCTSFTYSNCLLNEIQDRFPAEVDTIMQKLMECFNRLPLCCDVGGKIFCVHGCIPSTVKSVAQIKSLPIPLDPQQCTDEQNQLLMGLLWSDPLSAHDMEERNIQEQAFIPNTQRGIGEFVPEWKVESFLDQNGFDILLRGHEAPGDGFKMGAGCRVWTIFGASNYLKMEKDVQWSVVLEVQYGMVLKMHIFNSSLEK